MKQRMLTIVYSGGAPEKNVIFARSSDVTQYLRGEAWRPERLRIAKTSEMIKETVCWPVEYRYSWVDVEEQEDNGSMGCRVD